MIGRNFSGAIIATTVAAPVKRPAAPTPATARPTIKEVEVGAAPHTADPASKMSSATRKTHLTLKDW